MNNKDQLQRVKSYTGVIHFTDFEYPLCHKGLWLGNDFGTGQAKAPGDITNKDVTCKTCLIKALRQHPDMLSQGELSNLMATYMEELNADYKRTTGKMKEIAELMKKEKHYE